MSRFAVISDGVVVNVIVADAEFAARIGAVPVAESVSIGWSFDGDTFTPPAPEIETTAFPPLTGRQIKRVLRMIGITADMVDTQIVDLAAQQIAAAQDIEDEAERVAAIAEIELERDFALIDWQDAREYHRDYPLLNDIAAAFELPEEQVDTLWLWAAEL